MASHTDAEALISDLPDAIRDIAMAAHDLFIAQGCSSYVKTIYVGYELEHEMVAAMYGRIDHIEIAVALAEDAEHRLLVDAGHLTWRTLPVAAELRSAGDVPDFAPLALAACERVKSQQHTVVRDNDYFIKSRRERNRSRDFS